MSKAHALPRVSRARPDRIGRGRACSPKETTFLTHFQSQPRSVHPALYTALHDHYARFVASQFDESDFIDTDYQSAQAATPSPSSSALSSINPANPNLTRSELDAKVSEAQRKLADLKRAQEELERERAALEEARRRRIELETGREEMLQHLTRGTTLVEETEFKTRREAEQMAKTLAELREALVNVQAIREENWKPENWQAELTRALASIENARMEWNRARLKWTFLNPADPSSAATRKSSMDSAWTKMPLGELCRLGLALTWPLAVVALVAIGAVLFALMRR